MNHRSRDLWLPSTLRRVCLFLFFFSLLVLSLFLLGNFQNFLDSTQTMLLGIFETTSLLYVVAALFYIIILVVVAVGRKRSFKFLSMLLSLFGAAAFFATYLFFGFLFAWLKPVN